MWAGQYLAMSGVADEFLDVLGIEDKEVRANLKKQLRSRLYADQNDTLGSRVRSAMERKCKWYWQRSKKLVLRGTERLACFSADRALAIRATGFDDGVKFEWDEDTPVLACHLGPHPEPPIRLRVAMESSGARKDLYIRSAVAAIWGRKWTPGIVTIRFDRMRRKIDVMVAVTLPTEETEARENTAVLGPMDEHGQLWMRTDDGKNYDFSDRVRHMAHQKEHFQGIQRRIRATAGHGPKRRRVKRDLLARQSFQDWVEGPLHQLSAAVIAACVESGVGRLTVMGLSDGDLPWAGLMFQLKYKGEDAGIEVSDVEEAAPSHVRAKARKVRKDGQKLKRAKEGVKAIREVTG
jgi:hypothetical protein